MNRNLWLLAICQGLFLTNNVTFIAINGLVGLSLAPSAWMATLPVTGYVAGGALCAGLVARHLDRLGRAGSPALAWENSPIDDINQQQQQMEMVNTELGYLLPHAEREEYGKITPEGRFWVWKEAWLLDYLGLAQRY